MSDEETSLPNQWDEGTDVILGHTVALNSPTTPYGGISMVHSASAETFLVVRTLRPPPRSR